MKCYDEVIEVGESKKRDYGEVVLEVSWVGKLSMEGSNLAAHRWLKRWLFCKQKLVE